MRKIYRQFRHKMRERLRQFVRQSNCNCIFNKTEAPFNKDEEFVKQPTIAYVSYDDCLFRVIRSGDGSIISRDLQEACKRHGCTISYVAYDDLLKTLEEVCKQHGFTISYVAYDDRLFGVIRSSDGRIIDEVVMGEKISRFFNPAESDLQDSCVPRLKE